MESYSDNFKLRFRKSLAARNGPLGEMCGPIFAGGTRMYGRGKRKTVIRGTQGKVISYRKGWYRLGSVKGTLNLIPYI